MQPVAGRQQTVPAPPELRPVLWSVTIVLTVVFAALTGYASWRAACHDRYFAEWLTATPCDLYVALSRPGRFEAPFHQTCHSACKEFLCLELTDDGTPMPLRAEHMSGLLAEATLY